MSISVSFGWFDGVLDDLSRCERIYGPQAENISKMALYR
jgi:hypothetical protein